MNNVIGKPALDSDFFDRQLEQARLWARLRTDNLLLLAPRRVGKTSLLHKLQATAEVNGYHAVFVSVSDHRREIDFVLHLYRAIEKAQGGKAAIKAALRDFKRHLPRSVKVSLSSLFSVEFAAAAAEDWQPVGAALFKALRDLPGRWLLMVDELPLFVLSLLDQSRDRARSFLNWFREVRIDPSTAEIRWLLAGSIGLDTVAARERMGDTINDLKVEHLGPFSPTDADQFLIELASSYSIVLTEDVRAQMRTRIGWLIPYHIQLLFAEVQTRGVQPTVADVEAAYAHLLAPAHKLYFDYWVQRLRTELGGVDGEHALVILAAAARDGEGASRTVISQALLAQGLGDPDRHTWLLDVLQTDGYLVKEGERFRFRSPLLRDFWIQRVLG